MRDGVGQAVRDAVEVLNPVKHGVALGFRQARFIRAARAEKAGGVGAKIWRAPIAGRRHSTHPARPGWLAIRLPPICGAEADVDIADAARENVICCDTIRSFPAAVSRYNGINLQTSHHIKEPAMLIRPTRRHFLAAAAALPLASLTSGARAQSPGLVFSSRQIEVLGRAATVYGITGPDGRQGVHGKAGERFQLAVQNDTDIDIITHWHGQVLAAEGQDRAYTGGGALAAGAIDLPDFELTPGTHWMHAHQLSEQVLMAAPMIGRESDAAGMQEHVIMLHDFSFRSPEDILAGLGGTNMHGQSGAAAGDMAGMDMTGGAMEGMDMAGMDMAGGAMIHANDVAYDAFLANDRTLSDPEVVQVDPGAQVRLRIINGGTATAFWIDPGVLESTAIAVDGNPCQPLAAKAYPMAQGQRLDLVVTIPPQGGAFPIFAQVEAAKMRTGIVLATPGAKVPRLADMAQANSRNLDSQFDAALRAVNTLPDRAGRVAHVTLAELPGYRFTLNGAVHGEDTPIAAKLGERLELMFMNTGQMMHPMHLHGHHFQVVDVGMGRFNGPRRDVVTLAPGSMVTVAVDLDKPGSWYLHCHHLYHMATGMMTEVYVS